jgi:hypothetical protein
MIFTESFAISIFSGTIHLGLCPYLCIFLKLGENPLLIVTQFFLLTNFGSQSTRDCYPTIALVQFSGTIPKYR